MRLDAGLALQLSSLRTNLTYVEQTSIQPAAGQSSNMPWEPTVCSYCPENVKPLYGSCR